MQSGDRLFGTNRKEVSLVERAILISDIIDNAECFNQPTTVVPPAIAPKPVVVLEMPEPVEEEATEEVAVDPTPEPVEKTIAEAIEGIVEEAVEEAVEEVLTEVDHSK